MPTATTVDVPDVPDVPVDLGDPGHDQARPLPTAVQPRGRGVGMVDPLCDPVQIRASSAGTVVRVHSRLGHRPVR